MPLPETLPKSSAYKKAAEKKSDASASRNSMGLTTAGEISIFSWRSSVFPSDASSNDPSVSVDEKYITPVERDGYEQRDDDPNERMKERVTESMDDESILSYLNNSIVSMPSESVSVSGSETSSNSTYSHIYEPRIIQQQRQASKNRTGSDVKHNQLADIPEDRPLPSSGDSLTTKAKNHKKPVSSWKKLFKRHKREKATNAVDSAPRESTSVGKESGGEKSISRNIEMDDFTSMSPSLSSLSRAETLPANEKSLILGEDISSKEAVVVPAAGAGWLAVSSWFSADAVEHDSVAGMTETEKVDDDAKKDISNEQSKESEDSLFSGLASAKEEPKQVAPVETPDFDEAKKADTVPKHGRRIPAILPMPIPFGKKSKEMQEQQKQQRRRILSILESEDQSIPIDEPSIATYTLKQSPHHDSLSLNPVTSEEWLVKESHNIDGKDSSTLKKKSRRLKWPSTKRKQPENDSVANVEMEAREKDETFTTQGNPVELETTFNERGRSACLGKNHLKKIVVNAKAERLIYEGSLRSNVETTKLEPEPQSELEPEQDVEPEWEPEAVACGAQHHEYLGKKRSAHSIVETKRMLKEMDKIVKRDTPRPDTSVFAQHNEYLGKKKSTHSILEEKRMLREMDKIVKNRLRALEEMEKEVGSASDVSHLCGCSFLPMCD